MTRGDQELLSKLRARKSSTRSLNRPGGRLLKQPDALSQQAADRIEAQAAEIERLQGDLDLLRDAVRELLAHDAWQGDAEAIEIWTDRHWKALRPVTEG
ncbi:hypothetical protein [Aestuariispira insulae]|uniref:Uncharacterized protein n=1 Tax=Aestuariispira insulae TaxID=1461337 RepID=A0A3D9HKD6_9PROT|nr:hypothetical protein [Aestuariispira insulae]RED49934.1 hypothetical protein DFP90_105307 [Aestuariispira insulae]